MLKIQILTPNIGPKQLPNMFFKFEHYSGLDKQHSKTTQPKLDFSQELEMGKKLNQ